MNTSIEFQKTAPLSFLYEGKKDVICSIFMRHTVKDIPLIAPESDSYVFYPDSLRSW